MPANAQPLAEAQRQLELLLVQQDSLTPELYRDLALYLQVLREGLLPAVQQACFHLATQVVPERYGALPEQRRLAFQRRIALLVQRCQALLTVEQLMSLAAQQQRRRHRRHQAEQHRLLEAFLEGSAAAPSADERPPETSDRPVRPEPAGSVALGLALPVSADLFDRGLPGLPAAAAPGAEDRDLPLMQSLFQMASEGLQGQEPQPPSGIDDGPDATVTASGLPRQPLLQLSWWRHFDRALSRRLRNLSHALNVEMMKLGLAQGLLPLNLLDAVLEGQVEALPAPANLLRLPLPLPVGSAGPAEVLALLLRTSDLEYAQPRLRTCRRRLEQRRRALRTMAKRYRIWERRVAALEAEQQWDQDSAQLHRGPLTPP